MMDWTPPPPLACSLTPIHAPTPNWLFNLLLTGGLIGLAAVLILKSDRAARACDALREQLQADLADHRKQLQEDLPALVDPKIKQITDSIGTLQSNVSALGSRLDALDSRITALKDLVARSSSTT